ncbi:hypothetical protein MKQ68_12875 [Chitinophaga horti]|uniref:Uncharacterized protein n=1 Tax=Chitinophaga horti TaxID=2920382 RepID=A0ABY6IXX2_9BACT|nr:hypothetical protein [Chitinophaga horti]UYQ90986.1 hypothetical protein MKQ68_12875 [Chitinophaga horti]
MKGAAMAGGLVGACVLTALHELTRRTTLKAPRMDLLGMQVLAKGWSKTNLAPLSEKQLYSYTLAGDILSNAAYYSLAAAGDRKNLFIRAGVLGVAAGAAAICIPRKTGLNAGYSNRSLQTKALTVGLYLAGSLAAAAAIRLLDKVGPRNGQ